MKWMIVAVCVLSAGCVTLPDLPEIPKPEPKPVERFTATDHGRLIVWHVPGSHDNAGKRVEVYEDGYHGGIANDILQAVDGLTDWFSDTAIKHGWGDETSEQVRDAIALSIECVSESHLKDVEGVFSDGTAAPVPDKVLWLVRLSGGHTISLRTLAARDTIEHGAAHITDAKGRRLSNQTINDHRRELNQYNGKTIGIR